MFKLRLSYIVRTIPPSVGVDWLQLFLVDSQLRLLLKALQRLKYSDYKERQSSDQPHKVHSLTKPKGRGAIYNNEFQSIVFLQSFDGRS